MLSACGQSARHDFRDGRGDDTSSGGSAGAPGGSGASLAGAGSSGRAGTAGGGGISAGTGGVGAGSGGSSGAGGSPSVVDVSGSWAMFGFEDPVAVSLQQSGTTLSGTGCCAGLPIEGNDIWHCCADIASGAIHGRNAEFSFPVNLAPGVYAANVFVSSDGSRMAGPFHNLFGWGRPTAWLRLAPDQTWLPPPSSELFAIVEPRAGWYELALNAADPVAGFSPGSSYLLGLALEGRGGLVHGDLGAFWDSELSWSEADETLRAGPVPETHPDLPIELQLRFDSASLLEVVATFPSGETASFTVRAAM